MKRTGQYLIATTALLALIGCGQMRGVQKSAAGSRVVLKDDLAADYADCSRGLFDVAIRQDYLNHRGKVTVWGKGFMTEAPLPQGVTASNVMAEKLEPGIQKKAAAVTYAKLGSVVSVYFGSQPMKQGVSAQMAEGTLMRSASVVDKTKAGASVPPPLVLEKKKNLYVSEEIPLDADEAASIKSIVISSAKLKEKQAMAVNIPETVDKDAELEKGVDAVSSGGEMKIKVNANPNPSTGDFFIVQIRTISKKGPNWVGYYRVKDEGQSELAVPTKGTDMQNNASASLPAPKEGSEDLEVTVARSHLTKFATADGGNVCVQADAAVRTLGSVAAAKAKE
ncbi:MAG: hypothetical protein V1495_08930 [Pseudomonadota bacterium]